MIVWQIFLRCCLTLQVQAEAARQQSHLNYGKLGPATGMHPPGMRMTNHMSPNVSKPQHAVGTGGINVGPNSNANMGDWNSGPRFGQANNPNAMRSPNPNQMIQQNQMQGNQVSSFVGGSMFTIVHENDIFPANTAANARKFPDDSVNATKRST